MRTGSASSPLQYSARAKPTIEDLRRVRVQSLPMETCRSWTTNFPFSSSKTGSVVASQQGKRLMFLFGANCIAKTLKYPPSYKIWPRYSSCNLRSHGLSFGVAIALTCASCSVLRRRAKGLRKRSEMTESSVLALSRQAAMLVRAALNCPSAIIMVSSCVRYPICSFVVIFNPGCVGGFMHSLYGFVTDRNVETVGIVL